MNTKPSAYNIVESHASDIKVRLYTPAHQGVSGQFKYLTDRIYEYDVPFVTRSKLIEVEKYFSELYNTKHTFFLTGGATQGVLAAIALLGMKHRKIAIGLNSHIAVIHGIVLTGLELFFIPSKLLMPTAEEVISALETEGQEVDAVFLTHPSYEGTLADIQSIARYCRDRNIDLIIDEAHGSHFPFMEENLKSAIEEGGDIVIHSLHKYVGSLVQTALLHIPKNSRITQEQVMTGLALFENTTRSNLLILSIEDAIQSAFDLQGKSLFVNASAQCNQLRNLLDSFGKILTYDANVCDPLKIFLCSDYATGDEIAELLVERGVDSEYSNERGVLLIFSFQHREKDFFYVARVLEEIYLTILQQREQRNVKDEKSFTRQPIMRVLPREAFFAEKKKLNWDKPKEWLAVAA
ncbi:MULTISPECIES: aminotransferase class I/II-fold pyridoxal phosphate-dependent enzyme [Aerosakkonema]|uniref:aminotransferase class I/II-fold pyridoxal phosphate-dependent enzyme n=1 Tax=Aerosakkonema TaxID=1246629 RepID=UPI0035B9F193